MDFLTQFDLRDALDVLIVAFVMYRALLLIRGTRAVRIAIGLALVTGVYAVARLLELRTVDWVLSNVFTYIVFAVIVLYYTIEQTRLVEMNFAIVQGTDNVMQWWFYLATPIAWALIIVRVLQNLLDDVRRYLQRKPFLVDIQAIGKG